MTITPVRPSGTGIQSAGRPRHAFLSPQVIASDRATFVAAAMDAREAFLEGVETYNDHQLVELFIPECSPTESAETQKTYRRHLNRFRVFMRARFDLDEREQPGETFLSPGDTPAIDDFAASLRKMVNTIDPETGKPLMAKAT